MLEVWEELESGKLNKHSLRLDREMIIDALRDFENVCSTPMMGSIITMRKWFVISTNIDIHQSSCKEQNRILIKRVHTPARFY